MIQKGTCAIHDGSFHADEVTACALLVTFHCIERDQIHRTRDQSVIDRCEFVCDVGGVYDSKKKRFDHHQNSYTGTLSSAGMVLSFLKETNVLSSELFQYLNDQLVHGVDLIDNGLIEPMVGMSSFSNVITSFMPVDYEAKEEEITRRFFEALDFTILFLKRLIQKFEYIQSCAQEVIEQMKHNRAYLLFDRALPWMETFFANGGEQHPALFVIMPTGQHWKLRGIPPSLEERMQVKKPLPQEWAGLLEKELKEKTQIPGAVFCHKGKFISVWETKEDALAALDKVLEE